MPMEKQGTVENQLAHTIDQTEYDSRYDRTAKKLLANKQILAQIMKGCVNEYSDCTVDDIVEKYIEGTPEVGSVGVHVDDTNRPKKSTDVIKGSNNEDSTLTEGTLFYDVRFDAIAPKSADSAEQEEVIRLIINVEAQTKFKPGYPLTKRAIYYCSRMISAQHGPIFTKSEYGKIRKVYSIWICTQPSDGFENTLTRYSIKPEQLIGEAQEETEQTEGGSGQPGEGKGQGKGQNDPTEGERGEAELLGGHGASESSLDKGKGQRAKPVAFTGEVRDHPVLDGGSGTAQKQAEQEADIELVQAMQRAKHMGDMPAGLLRLFRKRLHPTLDWRGILQRFLENCADGDSTWTTPNRRYLYQGIYLPSRQEPRIPHIVLAVDSSGSVDNALLEMFCTELSGILESYDTLLTVLFHDTRVQSAQTFTRQDLPLRLAPAGGGGTDYRPVTAYIEENDLAPTCMIWFTDLECDRFPEEPAFPVLWLAEQPNGTTPPFGETGYLKERPSA